MTAPRTVAITFRDGGQVTVSEWEFVYEFGSADSPPSGLTTYQPEARRGPHLALARRARGVEDVLLLGVGQLQRITLEWPKEGDGLQDARVLLCDGSEIEGQRLEPPSSFLTSRRYTFAEKVFLEGSSSGRRFRKNLQWQSEADEPVTPENSIQRLDFAGCQDTRK